MASTTMVNASEMKIDFKAPWNLADYALFIRTKSLPEMVLDYQWEDDSYTLRAPARFAHVIGVKAPRPEVAPLPLNAMLFPYQAWIVRMALTAKRFAIWSDCGTGKTPMQLEFARQVCHLTGGRVLIMAPLAVCHQTVEEAGKFYPDGDVAPIFLQTRREVEAFCKEPTKAVGITNYDKMIPGIMDELRWLSGLILDESSILKGGGGVIKWNLIKSARGIEYKLSCTATPAPNDTMEYASQASFLEKLRTEGEILWTFFHRDQKTQVWHVKPHAQAAFFRFMAAWSIYLRKPCAYGFEDPFANIPEPEIVDLKVEATDEQQAHALEYLRTYDPGSLIPQDRLGVTARSKLSQIAKGFIYPKNRADGVKRILSNKPGVVCKLVREAIAEKRQALVWTVFDEESDILAENLKGLPIETLHGRDSEDDRAAKLDAFRHGSIRVLISKAELLGYGLNFQFCTRMIFSGFDDSFERFYQAVRRCYRYGSTEQLKVFVPYVPGLENHIWDNILRKKTRWEADTAQQEVNYREAMKSMKGRR